MALVKLLRVAQILMAGIGLVLLVNTVSFGAVEFDVEAIEAETTGAIASGTDPVLAAKIAVSNAVRAILAENSNYPGGKQALSVAILDALEDLKITGLDDTDLFLSANHALGNSVDPLLEAYEQPGTKDTPNQGGPNLGPGGKPRPASPT